MICLNHITCTYIIIAYFEGNIRFIDCPRARIWTEIVFMGGAEGVAISKFQFISWPKGSS
jgi:hypothetical protein